MQSKNAPRLTQAQKKREGWKAHINAWEVSGLSQRQFCEKYHLNKHTFSYYRRILRLDRSIKKKILPIEVVNNSSLRPASNAYFVLKTTSGMSLHIPSDCDECSLNRILSVLGVTP